MVCPQLADPLLDGLGYDPLAEAVLCFSGHDLDDLELVRQRFMNPQVHPCAIAFEIGTSRLFDMNSRKSRAQSFAIGCHPSSRSVDDEELSHVASIGDKGNFLATLCYAFASRLSLHFCISVFAEMQKSSFPYFCICSNAHVCICRFLQFRVSVFAGFFISVFTGFCISTFMPIFVVLFALSALR